MTVGTVVGVARGVGLSVGMAVNVAVGTGVRVGVMVGVGATVGVAVTVGDKVGVAVSATANSVAVGGVGTDTDSPHAAVSRTDIAKIMGTFNGSLRMAE